MKIMTPIEKAALRRCTTRDAYKVLARHFLRTGKRSHRAGLKAAATVERLKQRRRSKS